MIEASQHSIDIVMYDWRWYKHKPAHATQLLNTAIVRAAQRGVLVRAVLNAHTIVPLLKSLNIKARQVTGRRKVHSKLLLIDRKIAVVGSHNFTSNAFYRNLELSVVLTDPLFLERMARYFENLYIL